jgi:hypothetical protein
MSSDLELSCSKTDGVCARDERFQCILNVHVVFGWRMASVVVV